MQRQIVKEYTLAPIYTEYQEEIDGKLGVFPHEPFATKPVAIVSDKYTLINHSEVLEAIYDSINSTKHEVSVSLTPKDLKMIVNILDKTRFEPIRIGDAVQFGVTIVNSIDGTVALSITPYTLRLVCLNGATSPRHLSCVSMKHIGSVSYKDIVPSLETMVDSFFEVTDSYKEFVETDVIEMEQLPEGDKEWVMKSPPKAVIQQIVKINPKTQWDLFNILTEFNTYSKKNAYNKINFDKIIHKVVEAFAA